LGKAWSNRSVARARHWWDTSAPRRARESNHNSRSRRSIRTALPTRPLCPQSGARSPRLQSGVRSAARPQSGLTSLRRRRDVHRSPQNDHEQGDRLEQVYFPLSGMISLLMVMRNGQGIETATVGREGTVGAMSGAGPRACLQQFRSLTAQGSKKEPANVTPLPGSASRTDCPKSRIPLLAANTFEALSSGTLCVWMCALTPLAERLAHL
jgi:hypothetical protein